MHNVSWFALLDLSDDFGFFNTKSSYINVHALSESMVSLSFVGEYSKIE
jgi:hypothetical protein